MPKSAQYIITWLPLEAKYLITGPKQDAAYDVSEEANWRQWLEEHRSFAFHGRNGQLNLLREKRSRGSDDYWYAYQRQEGQMVKRYAGRSAQLSMERLEEIATLLAKRDDVTKENVLLDPFPAEVASAQFEPLLMPRLQLPRLQQSLLRREPLLNILDKSLEHTLTIISGPAGYGKTTAVVQWLADRSSRLNISQVAYLTLDEGG